MKIVFICPTAHTPGHDDFHWLRLPQSFRKYMGFASIVETNSIANVLPLAEDAVVFYDRFFAVRHGSSETKAFYDQERELVAANAASLKQRLVIAATGDGTYQAMQGCCDRLLEQTAACLFYHSKAKDTDTRRWPWLAAHSFAIYGPPIYRLDERPWVPYDQRAKEVYWLGSVSGIWSTENTRLRSMRQIQEALPTSYTLILHPHCRHAYDNAPPHYAALVDAFLDLKLDKVRFKHILKPTYLEAVARRKFLLAPFGNNELSVRYIDAAATGTVLLSPNLENLDLIGDWKAGVNYYDLGLDGCSRIPDFIEDFKTKPDSYWEDMGRACGALYQRFYAIQPDEAHTPETFVAILRRVNQIKQLFPTA